MVVLCVAESNKPQCSSFLLLRRQGSKTSSLTLVFLSCKNTRLSPALWIHFLETVLVTVSGVIFIIQVHFTN